MASNYRKLKLFTYTLISLILLVYLLVVARGFLYPIAISILFAYLLYPVVKWLEQHGVPRIVANLMAILVSIALIVMAVMLIYGELSDFLGNISKLETQAMLNIDKLQQTIDEKFGINSSNDEQWLRDQVKAAFVVSGGLITTVLSETTVTLAKLALMPVYVFLMLYYRNKLQEFLFRVLPSREHSVISSIIEDIALVTKKYMSGVVIVILILCFLNSTGLLLIGVEYALLLGIISALFNFIPYFGTLIGGAVPLLYTLVVQGSPQKTLLVLAFFLIIQFTENNILTPTITGSKVNINPMFTILSIIIGGFLWGLPGMFVAVPFLGMFKVICDHYPKLNAYSFLLGPDGTEEHALTFDKIKRFFKK